MKITLNESDILELKLLKKYAELDPYDEEDMRSLMDGNGDIPGDNPEFTRIILNNTCRVVFTHEWQPVGTCRHASISAIEGYGDAVVKNILPILGCLGFDGKNFVETSNENKNILHFIQLI